MRSYTAKELDNKTNEIAKAHGCDKAVFTVCWDEFENGTTCRCKEDAKRVLEQQPR